MAQTTQEAQDKQIKDLQEKHAYTEVLLYGIMHMMPKERLSEEARKWYFEYHKRDEKRVYNEQRTSYRLHYALGMEETHPKLTLHATEVEAEKEAHKETGIESGYIDLTISNGQIYYRAETEYIGNNRRETWLPLKAHKSL